MVCYVQVSGGKETMDVTGIFVSTFSLRQYYVIFCCFKNFSTPQGVICKLSYFKYCKTVCFTDQIQIIQFTIHLQNTVIN